MAASATDSQGKDKNIRERLVQTGDVDVMLSVGNNFFYTKSLPCTLWFFDKAKREENKDKVLFIDARNYYTAVDRTLNEWSEWQMKNLNAIVWLYRGEVDKYKNLIQHYYFYITEQLKELSSLYLEMTKNDDLAYIESREAAIRFSNVVSTINCLSDCFKVRSFIDDFYKAWDKTVDDILKANNTFEKISQYVYFKKKGYKNGRQFKKQIVTELNESKTIIYRHLDVIDEAKWLYEKFGEGEYRDILGLCKCATRTEIAEKGYSLTPGAYVGVAPIEDDGVDFAERMAEIHKELLTLQAESNEFMDTISKNMKEMGL